MTISVVPQIKYAQKSAVTRLNQYQVSENFLQMGKWVEQYSILVTRVTNRKNLMCHRIAQIFMNLEKIIMSI